MDEDLFYSIVPAEDMVALDSENIVVGREALDMGDEVMADRSAFLIDDDDDDDGGRSIMMIDTAQEAPSLTSGRVDIDSSTLSIDHQQQHSYQHHPTYPHTYQQDHDLNSVIPAASRPATEKCFNCGRNTSHRRKRTCVSCRQALCAECIPTDPRSRLKSHCVTCQVILCQLTNRHDLGKLRTQQLVRFVDAQRLDRRGCRDKNDIIDLIIRFRNNNRQHVVNNGDSSQHPNPQPSAHIVPPVHSPVFPASQQIPTMGQVPLIGNSVPVMGSTRRINDGHHQQQRHHQSSGTRQYQTIPMSAAAVNSLVPTECIEELLNGFEQSMTSLATGMNYLASSMNQVGTAGIPTSFLNLAASADPNVTNVIHTNMSGQYFTASSTIHQQCPVNTSHRHPNMQQQQQQHHNHHHHEDMVNSQMNSSHQARHHHQQQNSTFYQQPQFHHNHHNNNINGQSSDPTITTTVMMMNQRPVQTTSTVRSSRRQTGHSSQPHFYHHHQQQAHVGGPIHAQFTTMDHHRTPQRTRSSRQRRDNDPVPTVRLSQLKTGVDIEKLSTKEMKQMLDYHLVSTVGCIEKKDLVNKVKELLEDEKERRRLREQQETTDSDGRTMCKICMDDVIDCVLVECGHMVSCIECGKRLQNCPVCRQPIERVLKTFRS